MNTLNKDEDLLKNLDLAESKLKNENNLDNINNLINNLLSVFEYYNEKQQIMSNKITIYNYDNEEGNENIFVNEMKIDNYDYIGCFEDSGHLENTGVMNFNDCKNNAVDLGKPFFSLKNDGKETQCFLGSDLSAIVAKGESYLEDVVWQSTLIDPNIKVVDPILKVFGRAFAVLNYDNTILYASDYNYVKNMISKNKVKNNSESSILVLTNSGNLYIRTSYLITRGRGRYRRTFRAIRRPWNNRIRIRKGDIVNDWKPLNNPTSKYKNSYLLTGQFINQNESISSNRGTSIMKLGDDGILRIFKAYSKCSSNPKVGNQSGNAVHMLDRTLYDIQKNKHNNTTTLKDGVSFYKTAGECLKECERNNECKAAEYYKRNKYSKCELKSDVTNNTNRRYTTTFEKRDNSYLDLKSDLGKIGYVDKKGDLFEYGDEFVGYTDEYKILENTISTGKILKEDQGDAIIASNYCNELDNCGGFIVDSENTSYKLLDNTIYPIGTKRYSMDNNTFIRNPMVVNNETCPKNLINVTPDDWNSLNLTDTKYTPDMKCGAYKLIDDDLKELNNLEKKINSSSQLLLEKINDYSVFDTENGKELLDIYKNILERFNISFKQSKEGFINLDDKYNFKNYNFVIGGISILLIGIILINYKY
tara:strand:+ start:5638 stop:7575 length:1938 start_codon:yes stop_codon:yes gene_type:complete